MDLPTDTVVQTLGDLAKANVEDVPDLPAEARDRLLSDQTALKSLTDPITRQEVTGTVLRLLKLPSSRLLPFVNWLNSRLNELVPERHNSRSFVFTRRPHNSLPARSSSFSNSEETNEEGKKGQST